MAISDLKFLDMQDHLSYLGVWAKDIWPLFYLGSALLTSSQWNTLVQTLCNETDLQIILCMRVRVGVYIPHTDRPGGRAGRNAGRCTPDPGWRSPVDRHNRCHTLR